MIRRGRILELPSKIGYFTEYPALGDGEQPTKDRYTSVGGLGIYAYPDAKKTYTDAPSFLAKARQTTIATMSQRPVAQSTPFIGGGVGRTNFLFNDAETNQNLRSPLADFSLRQMQGVQTAFKTKNPTATTTTSLQRSYPGSSNWYAERDQAIVRSGLSGPQFVRPMQKSREFMETEAFKQTGQVLLKSRPQIF